jgi:hypothetical protein
MDGLEPRASLSDDSDCAAWRGDADGIQVKDGGGILYLAWRGDADGMGRGRAGEARRVDEPEKWPAQAQAVASSSLRLG